MRTEPEVSVLIIAHNEAQNIERCLSSVFDQTRLADEVVVVAHNCTDDTAAIVETFFPQVRLVRYDGPHGTLFARMKAFEEARFEYLASIDADSYADPKWIESLIEPLRDVSVVAVTNPTLFEGNLLVWLCTRFYFYVVYGRMERLFRLVPQVRRGPTLWVSFACRKSDVIRTGGLRPMIAIKEVAGLATWMEDLYLSIKLREFGHIVIVPGTIVRTQCKQKTSWQFLQHFLRQQRDESKVFAAMRGEFTGLIPSSGIKAK